MSNSTQNTTCTEGATFDVIPSDFSETMRSNSPEKAKIMSDAYDRGLEKQEALGIPEWDENMQEAYDRGYKKGLADARKEVMGKVKKLEKPESGDKYCGCDGECFGACEVSYNNALDDVLATLKEEGC